MSVFALAKQRLRRLLGHPIRALSGGITAEHVAWGYRLFLDREPENDEVVGGKVAIHRTTASLRMDFMDSYEFRVNNPGMGYITEPRVVIAELDDGLRLFVDLSDHVIGLAVVRGQYERGELGFMRRVLRPGDVVLDIGANIGVFTVAAAACVGPTGHVYAYEPLPRNVDLLGRSLRENGLSERVTLDCAAVGEAAGVMSLLVGSYQFNSGGSYVDTGRAEHPPGYLPQEVPVRKIDECALRRPIRFLKIDVEGAELLALRGAEAMIRADRPTILAEINTRQLGIVSGCTPTEFLAWMHELGYEAALMSADGDLAPDAEDPNRPGVRSVVFTPR